AGPGGVDEMEVEAVDLDAVAVVGESEAGDSPLDVTEREDVLVGDDLGEWTVRALLPGHRTGRHRAEPPVDPDRRGTLAPGARAVESGQHPGLRFRAGDRSRAPRGERDDDRERRPLGGIDLADPSVDVGAPEPPVDGDHLTVERVQGPEPEVAVPGELGEADVAL